MSEMSLVHVIWEGGDWDEGLVDVATQTVLCYVYGKRAGFVCDEAIPTVYLTDNDFGECPEPTWDEVASIVHKKCQSHLIPVASRESGGEEKEGHEQKA